MTKKHYSSPGVSRIEMDSDIVRMLTKKGFVDLFWEKLREAKKNDPFITHEKVFNALNEKYLHVIGCKRYSSYDTFRRRKDS